MNKYWTDKQDGVDDVSAGAFNDAFDMIAEDIGDLQNSVDDFVGLEKDSITTEMLKDKVVTVLKLGNDVVKEYVNLFNPENVESSASSRLRTYVDGVNASATYSFNFEPIGIWYDVAVSDTHFLISGQSIIDNGNLIIFNSSANYTRYMIVEGDVMPSLYVPFGESKSVNDSLLTNVRNDLEQLRPKLDNPVMYGEEDCFLQPNKVYSVDIGGGKVFRLPNVIDDSYAQILVQANVTVENSVDFGTTYFFNGETPYLEAGKYNLIWEWDGTNWYAGAISKGQGESV
ncbi:MAG: hypothetical protein IKY67_05795 [Paludibacteraceae bacterium]|nr:hypothetical protein [Paludibacteraceae bacterium]